MTILKTERKHDNFRETHDTGRKILHALNSESKSSTKGILGINVDTYRD